MSKAYRCDRCGDYYTDASFEDRYYLQHPNDTETAFDYIATGRPGRQFVPVDLCPNCTVELDNWLNVNNRRIRKGEKE